MALKKQCLICCGSAAEYWKIDERITVNITGQTIIAKLILYKDNAARLAGATPIPVVSVNLINNTPYITTIMLSGQEMISALASINADPRGALYLKAKAVIPFFSDAEDC